MNSKETEIASNDELFSKCTCFRYFMLAKGGTSKEDTLIQDNKSCFLMHKNRPFPIGKVSKHIHISYFFAVDKITKKEARVACCPTDKTIADYSTKPTPGNLFVFQ